MCYFPIFLLLKKFLKHECHIVLNFLPLEQKTVNPHSVYHGKLSKRHRLGKLWHFPTNTSSWAIVKIIVKFTISRPWYFISINIKIPWDLAAIYLKYFWSLNFDIAVSRFYSLTNPFIESFDFSRKRDVTVTERSSFVLVSFRLVKFQPSPWQWPSGSEYFKAI